MRFLLLCLLFFTVPRSYVFAQETDDDGFYMSSGPVFNGDQLTGYFTLQIGKIDEGTIKYTIKLLDRNADQIGKTVYESGMENVLELERIVYNGSHLGLILSGGEVERGLYLDILDGQGTRVRREILPGEFGQYVQSLYPVQGGFIINSGYDNTNRKRVADNRWNVRFIPNKPVGEVWSKTSLIDENDSEFIYLLDGTEELLLFGMSHIEKRGRKNDYNALLGMDPATGKELFRYKTPIKESDAIYTAADIRENGFTIVKDLVAPTLNKIELEQWSLEGKLISSEEVIVEGQLIETFDKQYIKDYYGSIWLESGRQFNADGTLTFGVESYVMEGGKFRFEASYTVVLEQDGQLKAAEKADRPSFALPTKYLGVSGMLPVMSRKGKDMMTDIRQHNGPLSFAGQQRSEDLSVQYFFNREFTKDEGVKYTSIQAIYYLDGELGQQTIPFESDADMVRIYPGKEGYFLVMEAYGDGSINTRLERLDF